MKNGIILVCSLLLVIGLFSCSEEACNTSTRTGMLMSFHTFTTDSIPKDSVIAVDIEGIYGIGREDSVLFEGQELEKVLLPLSLNSDTSRFVIRFPTSSDTLSFIYSRQVRYISKACGFVPNFEIISATVTHNRVKRLVIQETTISTSNDENIRLYF